VHWRSSLGFESDGGRHVSNSGIDRGIGVRVVEAALHVSRRLQNEEGTQTDGGASESSTSMESPPTMERYSTTAESYSISADSSTSADFYQLMADKYLDEIWVPPNMPLWRIDSDQLSANRNTNAARVQMEESFMGMSKKFTLVFHDWNNDGI